MTDEEKIEANKLREITLKNEEILLSPLACKSAYAGKRAVFEEPCVIRTDFQRDRDRIIHSSAFRRLKHKTQVFLKPKSEHFRTRLTHTLEVSQIARTISRALRLNEDLTEAIALGHDLGHTPFGHVGERKLNELYAPDGFKHYEQSVRVVERLERGGKGLNLTPQVKNGIFCHTNMTADTLEGVVVKLSDKLAYINHDIEDAVRAGIIKETDLPKEATDVLGHGKSERITSLIMSIITNSRDKSVIDYSKDIRRAHDILRQFMFDNVYLVRSSDNEKAARLVEYLYLYFLKNPEKMSDLYRNIAKTESIERAVCDYIAGMTDEFAVDIFTELFVPKAFYFEGARS